VTYAQTSHIEHVVHSVEQRLRDRPEQGSLDADTVLALDIVTHAIEFTGVAGGLGLWREALWGRTLQEDARVAVVRMLEHVLRAAERGETNSITNICDCLQQVVRHDVFGANAHIGGFRHSTRGNDHRREGLEVP